MHAIHRSLRQAVFSSPLVRLSVSLDFPSIGCVLYLVLSGFDTIFQRLSLPLDGVCVKHSVHLSSYPATNNDSTYEGSENALFQATAQCAMRARGNVHIASASAAIHLGFLDVKNYIDLKINKF